MHIYIIYEYMLLDELYTTYDNYLVYIKYSLGGSVLRRSLSIIMVIVMLLSITTMVACTKKSSNEFRVGMECDYAPFNWTQTEETAGTVPISSGGYAGGYDVEIAKRIAQGLGKELVIVKIEWDGLTPALTSGRIDAIIAGMSPTEERKETVNFSVPYYDSDLVVVVLKDSEYASASSISDFSGARITGQLNTFHYTVIDQIPNVDIQTAMETFPAMIVALDSGKIDGYISERPGAVSAAASNPNITFVEFSSGNGFSYEPEEVQIAVALDKKNKDLDKINAIINGITTSERETYMINALNTQPLIAE